MRAEFLQEITKERKPNRSEYPLCSNGHAMVWTFAFNYNEWACLPCAEVAPMFNGRAKAERNDAYMAAKKRTWADELHKLGSGTCIAKSKGKPCDVCDDPDFKFKYWKSNIAA